MKLDKEDESDGDYKRRTEIRLSEWISNLYYSNSHELVPLVDRFDVIW